MGEILKYLLPLPIPGSIYGLGLMLLFLSLKVIKIESVREVGEFPDRDHAGDVHSGRRRSDHCMGKVENHACPGWDHYGRDDISCADRNRKSDGNDAEAKREKTDGENADRRKGGTRWIR